VVRVLWAVSRAASSGALPVLLGGLDVGPGAVGVAIAGSTLTSLAGSLAFPAVRRRLSPSAITLAALGLLGVGWLLIGRADGDDDVASLVRPLRHQHRVSRALGSA
jgi:hypothetical protein